MSTLTQRSQSGKITTEDILTVPGLDIYQQMTCIILNISSDKGAHLYTVSEIADLGRMTKKEATNSLQALVEKKILSHKAFREIIGDFGDDRLSWTAKGILAFMKKNPRITFEELVGLSGQSFDDEHVVRTALEDLRRLGYLDELAEDAALPEG